MSIHIRSNEFSGEVFELPASPASLLKAEACSVGPETGQSSIVLRLAETNEDKLGAAMLLNRRFGWRGYGSQHTIPEDPGHTTFVALVDDQIVGTITLGIDSPAGLSIDSVFKDEVDVFRDGPAALVCELTKFAFETELPDQQNLAILFHTVFLYGLHNHQCSDLFIEVNPRHRRFYQSMLGFEPIGDMRTNPTVGAPSQLMWLNVMQIAKSISHHRTNPCASKSRSLYSLFLSQCEEAHVRTRLALRQQEGSLHGTNLIERSIVARQVVPTR
ncbi:N-acyl amino acid synthase FeeM domain-containing protein [Sphingomonas xinjiangensis]|uniref:N-acetyltransferase domain-containing protein n=1 Tax=Sphingomonas xinjiangensis TaxID=643568 RepID=A0A840YH19_9SPHN|nr:acetyltransferase [Sphingomonas xinjiangensis]MBB5712174.1 hypothetical protein [Sphingomonas xinjiangensis]